MRSHKLPGFSMAEMLIALAIVVLLALISVFSLRSTGQAEELRAAAGQLAADVRGVQSRALSAQSVKACAIGTEYGVCENLDPGCAPNPCQDAIPAAYGIYAGVGSSTYAIFADLNPVSPDGKLTDSKETLLNRQVLVNSEKVKIDAVTLYNPAAQSQPWVDVSFARQSGQVQLISPLVGPAQLVRIRLIHVTTGATIEVEVNKATGRVSII